MFGKHKPQEPSPKDMKQLLEQNIKNSIVLDIPGQVGYAPGRTHFGGRPDLPADFVWPTFEGESVYDDETKRRPLSFLAQFDCGELAKFDPDGLLPDHGLLSFFYETVSQRWGFDPKDRGCARVYWFEDPDALRPTDFPEELDGECRFPELGIGLKREISYPAIEDLREIVPGADWDAYEAVTEEIGATMPDNRHKLLGWPDTIQGSMPMECELIGRGYYLGSNWNSIPDKVKRNARATAPDRWRLLFQLDTVSDGDFELMFGDCGRLYFFIPKEDLAARRFDRVWLILQCG